MFRKLVLRHSPFVDRLCLRSQRTEDLFVHAPPDIPRHDDDDDFDNDDDDGDDSEDIYYNDNANDIEFDADTEDTEDNADAAAADDAGDQDEDKADDDIPPDVPVLHLLALLIPLSLGDGVGQQFEECVGEALDDLVHLGCLQVLLVELAHRVVLLQLLHCHFKGQPGLLLHILIEEPSLTEHLVRGDQLPVGRKDLEQSKSLYNQRDILILPLYT